MVCYADAGVSDLEAELRKVYVARGPGDAHLVKGLLESAGIQVVVRGDDFVPLQGGSLFHLETRPSLWVLDPDAPRAIEIVTAYETGAGSAGDQTDGSTPSWVCAGCGEQVEGQFSECWSCGAVRPRSTS